MILGRIASQLCPQIDILDLSWRKFSWKVCKERRGEERKKGRTTGQKTEDRRRRVEKRRAREKEGNERKKAGRKCTSIVHSLSFSSDDHRLEERNTQGSWLRGMREGGREVGCRGVAGARDGWRGWYLPSPRALTGRYSNNTGKHREINMASVALFPLASPCLSSSRSPRFAQTSTLSLLPSLSLSLATLAPLLSLPRLVSLLLTPFNPLSVSFPVGLPRSARTGEPIMRGCYSGPIPNHPERENWRDESPRRAHVRC